MIAATIRETNSDIAERDVDGSEPDLLARAALIRILQSAYSGELGAAYAYRGHWKSSKVPLERKRIQQIESEEWIHREKVGAMLESLNARPIKAREAIMWMIGRSLGGGCYIMGRFLPIYFAGRLESMNVKEYEAAASHAGALGFKRMESELRDMAKVEREHEMFFLHAIANHRLLPLMRTLFRWGQLEQHQTDMMAQRLTRSTN